MLQRQRRKTEQRGKHLFFISSLSNLTEGTQTQQWLLRPHSSPGLCLDNSNHIQQGGLLREWLLRAASYLDTWEEQSLKHSCQLCFHEKMWLWRHKRHFRSRTLQYSESCFKAVFLNLKYIKINFFDMSKDRCFRTNQQDNIWHVTCFPVHCFQTNCFQNFLYHHPPPPPLYQFLSLQAEFLFFNRVLSKSTNFKW